MIYLLATLTCFVDPTVPTQPQPSAKRPANGWYKMDPDDDGVLDKQWVSTTVHTFIKVTLSSWVTNTSFQLSSLFAFSFSLEHSRKQV